MQERGTAGSGRPDVVLRLGHGGVPSSTSVLSAFPLDEHRGGASSLERELAALPPDATVVLCHDDVEIDDRSAALLAAAVRRERVPFVVPFTNDLGTDHSLGTEDGLADGAVRAVRLVRPSCMAGRAAELLALVPRRLHDPLTLLADVDLGAAVVGGTRAQHRNSCVDHVRDRGRGPTPPIVASMIVRDEEAMLGDCLASLRDVVDRMVVVDTGSVDGTVALARSFGAEVIHREWRDDFAWARNVALAAAPDAAWALWIDADERLDCSDPQLLRGYLRCFAEEHDILELTIRNLRRDGSETTRFFAPRVLRAPKITFWGALHEHPIMRDESTPARRSPLGLCSIDHFGYADDVLEDRGKQDRNVAVAEAAYERDPRAKTALDLARSLTFGQRDEHRAVDLYRRGLEGVPEQDHRARAFVHAQLAGHLQDRCGDEEAALAEAEAGLELVPADVACRAVMARALFALGRDDELVERAADLDRRPSLAPMSASVDAVAVWQLRLAVSLARRGRIDEAWALAVAAAGSGTALGVREVTDLLDVAGARPGAPLPIMFDAVLAVAHAESKAAVLRTLAANRPRPEILELCRALVDREGWSEAVVLGSAIAMLEGRDSDVAWFVDRAGSLDGPTMTGLRERLRTRGMPELADRLARPDPPSRGKPRHFA